MKRNIQEVQYLCEKYLEDGELNRCVSSCTNALVSVPGLDWPYLYIADCYWEKGNKVISKVFYRLFLDRTKQSPEDDLFRRVKWRLGNQ